MKPIDVHAHWYPRRFLDLLASEGPAHGLEWSEGDGRGPQFRIRNLVTGPAGPRYVDLDARLEAMDEQGVAVHALSLSQPMVYWAGRRLGERLAAVFNEELARAHQQSPQRLVGLASLPMHEPDLAMRELERAAQLPGVRGVYVATRILDRELSEEAFFPVYERLEALGVPLFLHPVFVIDPERLQRFYLTNLLGNPFESAIAAAHLIFGGVLDRFPRLKLVTSEYEVSWIPSFMFRIDQMQDDFSPRLPLPRLALRASDYMRTRVFHGLIDDPYAAVTIPLVGVDQVLWGSDFPHVRSIGLDTQDRLAKMFETLAPAEGAKIVGGSAARLYNL